MRDMLPANDILLIAGGNTIDPLDPAYLALGETEGRMIHFGAPSHPGSMFWLAEIGDVPVFNLASCSMYSMSTFADLVLPLVMTGERVTEEEIDEFGYGGLLEREMRFRFPPYDQDVSDEENE
jgi:molybdopterin biosynthesis enzyme